MDNIIEIECPLCHGKLWIDPTTRTVVQHEKSHKKVHSSFEDLLTAEKVKKEKTEERFLQAKHLEEAKKKKAEELFAKSISEKS